MGRSEGNASFGDNWRSDGTALIRKSETCVSPRLVDRGDEVCGIVRAFRSRFQDRVKFGQRAGFHDSAGVVEFRSRWLAYERIPKNIDLRCGIQSLASGKRTEV